MDQNNQIPNGVLCNTTTVLASKFLKNLDVIVGEGLILTM